MGEGKVTQLRIDFALAAWLAFDLRELRKDAPHRGGPCVLTMHAQERVSRAAGGSIVFI